MADPPGVVLVKALNVPLNAKRATVRVSGPVHQGTGGHNAPTHGHPEKQSAAMIFRYKNATD